MQKEKFEKEIDSLLNAEVRLEKKLETARKKAETIQKNASVIAKEAIDEIKANYQNKIEKKQKAISDETNQTIQMLRDQNERVVEKIKECQSDLPKLAQIVSLDLIEEIENN